MIGTIILALYNGFGYLAVPLLHWLFARRLRRQKEIASRKGERFGKPGQNRPKGGLIWIHAASVGETNSVFPLIEKYCDRGLTVLLTTGTVSSARLASAKLPKNAIHQFVPYDAKPLVDRFLHAWRPDAAILVESEIWPAIIVALGRKRIPCIVVNGRMSIPSLEKWQRIPGLGKRVFGSLTASLTQSEVDAERFECLGVPRVESPGNLKYDTQPLPIDKDEFELLKSQIGERVCWLAASTHPGEEKLVVDSHLQLKVRFPGLLSIIVPRHPERGGEILDLCNGNGLDAVRRSKGSPIKKRDEVYIADTLGEIGLFYKLCGITFLGGSLVGVGGHNPVEPAQLGCAILTGSQIHNNKRMFDELQAADGVQMVKGAEDLTIMVSNLLSKNERARELARNAKTVVDSGRGALKRSEELIDEILANAS